MISSISVRSITVDAMKMYPAKIRTLGENAVPALKGTRVMEFTVEKLDSVIVQMVAVLLWLHVQKFILVLCNVNVFPDIGEGSTHKNRFVCSLIKVNEFLYS